MSALNRREFIAASAATLAISSAGKLAAETPSAEASGQNKTWYSSMLRCGQVNFNEQDPLTMDAEAWMDYWASLKVIAVMLNGGGIMAFYPTKVPYHHRSEFLGSRDLFRFCSPGKSRCGNTQALPCAAPAECGLSARQRV